MLHKCSWGYRRAFKTWSLLQGIYNLVGKGKVNDKLIQKRSNSEATQDHKAMHNNIPNEWQKMSEISGIKIKWIGKTEDLEDD